MRTTSKSRSLAIGFGAGFMVLLGMGCTGTKQGATAAIRSPIAEAIKEQTTTAMVTHIDPEKRVVTMREANGDRTTVSVSDDVILGRMDVGDKVRIEYEESLGFELLEPGQSIDEVEFAKKALPAGVLFGRRVATTVEILKVANEGESTTFRSEDGAVHKLKRDAKAKRTNLAHLRPGDDVTASCTEKLSIKLQR